MNPTNESNRDSQPDGPLEPGPDTFSEAVTTNLARQWARFYIELKSRGISDDSAVRLTIAAFEQVTKTNL